MTKAVEETITLVVQLVSIVISLTYTTYLLPLICILLFLFGAVIWHVCKFQNKHLSSIYGENLIETADQGNDEDENFYSANQTINRHASFEHVENMRDVVEQFIVDKYFGNDDNESENDREEINQETKDVLAYWLYTNFYSVLGEPHNSTDINDY